MKKTSLSASDEVRDQALEERENPESSRYEQIANSLGFTLSSPSLIDYLPGYKPPVRLSCGLIMVPHGKTESNIRHLFQSHSDSQKSQLTSDGLTSAQRGAETFVMEYGSLLRNQPDRWFIYRSPLTRTETTSAPYIWALRQAGALVEEAVVDPDLLEINHGSWDGMTVDDLAQAGRQSDAEQGKKYRNGSFVAKAVDGSGECKLEVIHRAAKWLDKLESRHGGGRCNVLVFGHGTFQNSVELLLRCVPDRTPAELFSRNPTGGTHIRRGEAHILAPLQGIAHANLTSLDVARRPMPEYVLQSAL